MALVQRRTEYVVKPASDSESDRVAACRAVLGAVAGDLTRFETDIPWSMADEWPAEVRAAAEILSAADRRRRGTDDYRQTGIQEAGDPGLWEAFVAFAPYAFDASAWSAEGRPIVSLADCATSIAVRLRDDQVEQVAAAISPARLTR